MQLDINGLRFDFNVFFFNKTEKYSDSFGKDDNSTIAITSVSSSAKNKDFNGFVVGSEKRSPSSENDLFTNSEREIINVFLSVLSKTRAKNSQ
jgi:hypothetical protein